MKLWTRNDRELLALAVPTFATLITEPLLVLADTAFIGHVGSIPLAGLGLGSNVLGVVTGLCVFLAYSTTSTVARRLGTGDTAAAFDAGRDGMALGLVLGIVLAAVLVLGAPQIIGWYRPAPEVASQAVSYLRLVVLGLPFQLVVLASTGLLRGLQDARTPLYIAIGVNLTNIGLDALLIYGFGMGIRGSASATATAQACSAVVLFAVVARRAARGGASMVPSVRGMAEAARHGGWLVVRTAALWISLTATTVVATHLGSHVLAAHQVVNSLWSFISFALDALAIACQSLVARRLGASDVPGAVAVMVRALGWGCVQALLAGGLLVAARPLVIGLFTPDPQLAQLLMGALVVIAFLQPLASAVFVLDGVLIGAGDTRFLALAGLAVVAVHLPMLVLVDHYRAGLIWLWIAYGGFLMARGVTLLLRARSGRWVRVGV
ncbi:MATE family efflux transporter [Propionibacterium cyclohexanicum]|uniref:MATE family efflux transporter n=1 Tax=Propionibacterium cyclohexanicum TaxID=64702 RepID=UPI000B823C9D|nr:MATE family efflux transporter [Propionibacterium cyclohexanicum]